MKILESIKDEYTELEGMQGGREERRKKCRAIGNRGGRESLH